MADSNPKHPVGAGKALIIAALVIAGTIWLGNSRTVPARVDPGTAVPARVDTLTAPAPYNSGTRYETTSHCGLGGCTAKTIEKAPRHEVTESGVTIFRGQ